MVPLVKTVGGQYCRQSTVWAKLPTLESYMIQYGVLNFKSINGANVTISGNVGANGTIGSPNGTIGKLNGVNINIMITSSNLFLYSYFLWVYFSISIMHISS